MDKKSFISFGTGKKDFVLRENENDCLRLTVKTKDDRFLCSFTAFVNDKFTNNLNGLNGTTHI
jgi:hypothetical protein